MNVSSIWSLILTTSSVQMTLFGSYYKNKDLKQTLQELEPNYGLPRVLTYDYIVVGGGTAGCLIAGKLSEFGFHVLLLEKGGDTPPAIMSPLLESVRNDPNVNEFYRTTPQDHSYQNTGGVGTVSMGTMLGGSGAHNYLYYNRGSPEAYDQIADLLDDPSFSYRNMLQYYKEFEDMKGFLLQESERAEYYGIGGPFSIETDLPAIYGDWLEIGRSLGFEFADLNAHQRQSFTPTQITARDSIRETSYTAFILRRPNPNLRVLRYSTAVKVLIKDDAAYGVLYKRHGIAQLALAEKEVIVTSGIVGSPTLLILSGIGPSSLLEMANIHCHSNLPGVGASLQDHPTVLMSFDIRNPISEPPNDTQLVNFLATFPGAKKATGFNAMLALLRSPVLPETGKWPDIMLTFGQNLVNSSQGTGIVSMIRPVSEGSLLFNLTAIRIGVTEASQIVQMNPAYYTVESDMEAMIYGLRFYFEKVLSSPQLQARGVSLQGNIYEGCASHEFFSSEFWRCFAETRTSAAPHFVGTCRMGKNGDIYRVVDPQFRVQGILNLRVADSSVIPHINSNTQAPTLAFAAKAARTILEDAVSE